MKPETTKVRVPSESHSFILRLPQLASIPTKRARFVARILTESYIALPPTISTARRTKMSATQVARISGRISLRTASRSASGLSISHNAIAYEALKFYLWLGHTADSIHSSRTPALSALARYYASKCSYNTPFLRNTPLDHWVYIMYRGRWQS